MARHKLTQEEFIRRCNEKHNGKYIYDKTIYNGAKENIIVTCPIHGDFEVEARYHMSGVGCPKCRKHNKSDEDINERKKCFLEKSKNKYGDKYEFPNINEEFRWSKSKITTRCTKCGRVFTIIANNHLTSKSGGCDCVDRSKKKDIKPTWKRLYTYEELNKYIKKENFKLVPFEGEKDKYNDYVTIHCEKHGDFLRKVNSVTQGFYNCDECGKEKMKSACKLKYEDYYKRLSKDLLEIIEPIKETYIKGSKNMTFRCKICGHEFERIPINMVTVKFKHPCPKCALKLISKERKKTTEQYIEEAKKVHGENAYDYSQVKYNSSYDIIKLKCNECGREFSIEANSHLRGHGCPYHYLTSSKKEKELLEFIQSIGEEALDNDRELLDFRKELDIYLPTKKIEFEFDGLYWHCEKLKGRFYHILKTNECYYNGVRLFHIFEDEWINKKEIWKSIILNVLDKTPNIYSISDCTIREVEEEESLRFLNDNSLEYPQIGNIRLGLYKGEELVLLMVLGKSINGKGIIDYDFELIHLCDKIYTKAEYGVQHLFKHFVEQYKPNKIISYSDLRFDNGTTLKELGLTFKERINPDFWYVKCEVRKHKSYFDGNNEEVLDEKWNKIYDCGKLCYEFINN